FDDASLTSGNALGFTDQSQTAIISSRMENNFIGPQLGVENQMTVCQGLTLGLSYKGAVGIDYAREDYTVANAGFSYASIGQRLRRNLASVQEFNVFFDTYYLERLRMRVGYRVLWLLNFPE